MDKYIRVLQVVIIAPLIVTINFSTSLFHFFFNSIFEIL